MTTKVHGFSSKSFIVPTVAGLNTYYLGDYQTDNFGEGAKVIAISVRPNVQVGPSAANVRSVNDREIIGLSDILGGYLYLVKDGPSRENICFAKNLATQTIEKLDETIKGDIFIFPSVINWNESYISFSPTVAFDGTKDIEFNVYYTTPCQEPIIPNVLFDNKFEYNAIKKKTIQVNVKANQASFVLADGRNPLTNYDKIVGLRYNNFQFVTEDGRSAPSMTNFLGSSFLTMKVGSRLLLENFPLEDLEYLKHVGYPYFPIEPTNSDDFDWTGCKVTLSDKSLAIDNYSFLITLFYM